MCLLCTCWTVGSKLEIVPVIATWNEFAKKLWGGQTFVVYISITSPCSLNRSKTFFAMLAKTGTHYGTYILFW